MIKAIVFDLDDTLISELDYIKSGYNFLSKYLSEKLNIDQTTIYRTIFDLFDESRLNVFNRLFDKFEINYSEKDIQELVFLYRNHIPKIAFYEDVFPCVRKLSEEGIKTGIITDGYTVAQRNKLDVIKAKSYFNEIIVTDELGREYWKPHPKAFELIKEKLNVEYDEMIYVGDNPEKDFYISHLLPIRTVRLIRPNGMYVQSNYLHNKKENVRIESLTDLVELIYS